MTTLPSTTQFWTGLSPDQETGASCLWCSGHDAPMVPAGFSDVGQVFACAPTGDGRSCAAHVKCLQLVCQFDDGHPSEVIDLAEEIAAFEIVRAELEKRTTALKDAVAKARVYTDAMDEVVVDNSVLDAESDD